MRNSLLCFTIGFAAFLLGACAYAGYSFRFDDQVTASNWQKIKKRMTRQEVETILGGPANATWSFPAIPGIDWGDVICPAWSGKIGRIRVVFDGEAVERTEYDPLPRLEHPTFVERFWGLFGWQV